MTRLHRLYPRRLQAAINVIDEPENRQPDGHDELSYPAKYPQGEEPDNIDLYPHGQMRIEGAEHTSTIIAIKPTPEAANRLRDAYPDFEIDPDELHITVLFLGKGLDDIEHLKDVINPVLDAHQPLECHTQGLGVFDHIDEGGRPFYASVDALGLAALHVDLKRALQDNGIDVPSDYDFTPHMTIGYVDPEDISIIDGSPDLQWTSDEIVIMHGGDHIPMKLGGHPKEASGFGFSLDEIITPSKGQGFTDNPADNHQTENLSEDPDLKLGEVEEPYSSDQGPLNFRFENKPDENIVKGADQVEAVALPDSGGLDENSYTDGDNTRQDRSITRSPDKEVLMYTR
jgi:2'-5' RNA ligase